MATKRKPTKAKKAKSPKNSSQAALANDVISRTFLGRQIQKLALRRGLSRNAMGAIVDDAASQMSRLMTDHFEEFSAERLVGFLVDLGASVDVVITPPLRRRPFRRGKVSLVSGII